ncbi:hypothetical protein ABAC460_09920 [Asticcacaulis sp. AC460]|uniref:type II toxin-antitoxin system VapC family toxin n=1 Tax=Asticcacaulis sp. AC460 TaxID=1282360 RepID=UPI0003C3C253|nr:type II toxin-antitoxin system VapC family toxin [Asticcacaulis sp. AC460]ESQ90075.1 hypothetical protein ABAC460_09920 [Asticcacaulis sp. AC460]
MTAVLDSSAVLALLWREKGCDIVETYLRDAMISTINLAEVYTKCTERSVDPGVVASVLAKQSVTIVDFSAPQALLAGKLRQQTKALGLSLGDRACLAVAMMERATVVTADKPWANVGLNLKIVVIR